MPKIISVFILVIILLLNSCIPLHKLEYLQDPVVEKNVFKLNEKPVNRIKQNDELYIRVSSFDDVAHNFFGTQSNTNFMNTGTDVAISLISYIVNDSGYIYFPILDHIYVNGLTIDEATLKLKNLLSEYFNQPTVIIKFVNKRISVLGEVENPGSFIYTHERINVFEALSLAGDITIHGNKKDILLLRTENDSIIKIKMNLLRDEILYSNYYYLKSDDILYVRPRNSVKWSVITVPVTLALSTITTALLLINYMR
jgi:polysaccharide export outer membrane protein